MNSTKVMDQYKKNNNTFYHLSFLVLLAVWFVVYYQTLKNMVGVWLGSETYSYCFLILPITLYLINEKKAELANLSLQNNALFLIPLFIGQIGFLLADLAGVSVLTHLAAYGTLFCLVGIVYGYQVVKFLIFPLSFLVLCVPMGEELVPTLQNITADISVFLVELVGIPVYREGLYIYIPNGTFEVAEACSGIRFLISMIAIGVLYAYLFYQCIWRRLGFILLSIIIPILANGIRAFGIIYIGHITDMKHAVGADHLVYGWLFFSIVLLLLMAVGKIWQEPEKSSIEENNKDNKLTTTSSNLNVFFISIALLFMTLKPLYENFIVGSKGTNSTRSPIVKYLTDNGAKDSSPSWGASFIGADKTYSLSIMDENIAIEYYVADYYEDDQHKEMINWGNKLFDIDKFSIVSESAITLPKNINATLLEIVSVRGEKKQLLYWYQVDDVQTSNSFKIKKAQLLSKLQGGSGGGKLVMLSLDAHSLSDEKIIELLSNVPWVDYEN